MKKKNKHNGQTRHHLVPKERLKLSTENIDQSFNFNNRILWLWRNHHDAWHCLFGNLTLEEIIKVLQRIQRFKSYH